MDKNLCLKVIVNSFPVFFFFFFYFNVSDGNFTRKSVVLVLNDYCNYSLIREDRDENFNFAKFDVFLTIFVSTCKAKGTFSKMSVMKCKYRMFCKTEDDSW